VTGKYWLAAPIGGRIFRKRRHLAVFCATHRQSRRDQACAGRLPKVPLPTAPTFSRINSGRRSAWPIFRAKGVARQVESESPPIVLENRAVPIRYVRRVACRTPSDKPLRSVSVLYDGISSAQNFRQDLVPDRESHASRCWFVRPDQTPQVAITLELTLERQHFSLSLIPSRSRLYTFRMA
jgi:hypothetical protein